MSTSCQRCEHTSTSSTIALLFLCGEPHCTALVGSLLIQRYSHHNNTMMKKQYARQLIICGSISLLFWLNLSLDLNFTTGYSSVSSTLMSYLDISDSWLNSTRRYGNTNPGQETLTNNILQGLLLLPKPDNNDAEFLRIPLSQSVALRNSSFLTWKEVPGDEAGTTHYDAHRLIYLAIHEHQHRPARKEAAKRIEMYKNPGKYSEWLAHLNKSNVGQFDYDAQAVKVNVCHLRIIQTYPLHFHVRKQDY